MVHEEKEVELELAEEEEIVEIPVEQEEQEEEDEFPTINEDWAEGKFTVNITRCHECHLHFNYSRHSEDEYVNAFNEMASEIQTLFNVCEVIGNREKPSYSGCFDVYLRGVGPIEK